MGDEITLLLSLPATSPPPLETVCVLMVDDIGSLCNLLLCLCSAFGLHVLLPACSLVHSELQTTIAAY